MQVKLSPTKNTTPPTRHAALLSRTSFTIPRLVLVAFIGAAISACQAPVVNPNSPSKPTFPTVPSKPHTSQTQTQPLPDTDELGSQPLPDESAPSKPVKPPKPITSAQVIQQQSGKRTPAATKVNDGSSIPAFDNLMKLGISQLRAGELSAAENTFTKAQRLGPQSPAVYLYLSEVAIKRGQGSRAENLARRGLLVSRSARYDKALWKMVEISGKMRGRPDIIKEAQGKLAGL